MEYLIPELFADEFDDIQILPKPRPVGSIPFH